MKNKLIFGVFLLMVAIIIVPNVNAYTTTIDGAYTILTFTTTDNYTFSDMITADILIIAGGGGGGTLGRGGGGGAGGLLYETNYTIPAGTYTITIGQGGVGAYQQLIDEDTFYFGSTNGENSSILNLTTIGGGYGGYGEFGQNEKNGGVGGSGGGAGTFGGSGYGGNGTFGQGFDGGMHYTGFGTETAPCYGAGGGGGAGGQGGNGTDIIGGVGGLGLLYSINGTSTMYATGGVGGCEGTETLSVIQNTGNGGDGGGDSDTSGISGSNGIIIIRFLTPCAENWVQINSSCNGIVPSVTILYEDQNACGTDISLPVNNGTVVNCCVEAWSASYTPSSCPSNSLWQISWTDSNTCGTTFTLPGNNGSTISCVYIPPLVLNQTFQNQTTTDLNTVENISAVQNFTVVTESSGVVFTNTTIDLSNVTSIEEIITITPSFISIDTTIAPELNQPALVALTVPQEGQVTACDGFLLYYSPGVYSTTAQVIANGQLVATSANIGGSCAGGVCTNIQCSAEGILTFTATGFSSFGVGILNVDAATNDGLTNTRNLLYGGLALLSVGIIVIVAWGLISVFKGGSADFMTLAITIVGAGMVIILSYIIIYFIWRGLGGA